MFLSITYVTIQMFGVVATGGIFLGLVVLWWVVLTVAGPVSGSER